MNLRRSLTILLVLFLSNTSLVAQNNVGIGTASPNTNALLDITSTTKGVLIPRMNSTQMNAITSPTGIMVYNTDSNAFAYRNATAWVFLKGNVINSNNWNTLGNAGTSSASHFIGTTNDQDLIFKRNNLRAGLLGTNNTSWGNAALNPATTGNGNVAFGVSTLSSNTTGTDNTAVGNATLQANTTGGSNTAAGSAALYNNTTGGFNTAYGVSALQLNTTGDFNNASGYFALYNNTTGSNNVAYGYNALFANTAGYSNIAIGSNALRFNTDRSNLVAIGDSALFNNGLGASSSEHALGNVAVGSKSLFANTTGYNNTATGFEALKLNTTGSSNMAAGYQALDSNTTGNNNTATGVWAMFRNTTGFNNTAYGLSALYDNKTGYVNTAIGMYALNKNISGISNTATGYSALTASTTGDYNTAMGTSALLNNVTGSSNTAVGMLALYSNNASSSNTAMGYQAGYLITGGHNIAIGVNALYSNSAGNLNTAIGNFAGSTNNGNANVFLGYSAGQNETGSNKLYIANSNADANNALIYGEFDNQVLRINGNLGIGQASAGYKLSLKHDGFGLQIQHTNAGATSWDLWQGASPSGNLNLYTPSSNVGNFNYTTGVYSATSDRRLKENIRPMNSVLEDIMKLQASSYTYKTDPEHKESIGFIAQDVELLFPQLVTPPSKDGGRETNYTMNYAGFAVLAIKAIQEQQKIIETQEERIARLEALVKELLEKK